MELLLALLEVLEVRLELPVAMRFLEGEATQSCRQCLEDQEATECNVVIEICRRLTQVKIYSGVLIGREIFPSLPYSSQTSSGKALFMGSFFIHIQRVVLDFDVLATNLGKKAV